MAQVYTFTDSNGEVRLMAEINPAPGGSPPVTREFFYGSWVTIPSGVTAGLTWDNPDLDALLDLSVPTAPTAIAAGVYAVALWVTAGAPTTSDADWYVDLQLDTTGQDAEVRTYGISVSTSATLTINLTWYVPAGGSIVARVHNGDSADRLFKIVQGNVQRLS